MGIVGIVVFLINGFGCLCGGTGGVGLCAERLEAQVHEEMHRLQSDVGELGEGCDRERRFFVVFEALKSQSVLQWLVFLHWVGLFCLLVGVCMFFASVWSYWFDLHKDRMATNTGHPVNERNSLILSLYHPASGSFTMQSSLQTRFTIQKMFQESPHRPPKNINVCSISSNKMTSCQT